MAQFYNVLWNSQVGFFSLSRAGLALLQRQFPAVVGLDKDGNAVRDHQDIIRYMEQTDLAAFEGDDCTLSIQQCPIYEGVRLPYRIKIVDGYEQITVTIDYREIARDLATGENNNFLTAHIRNKGFEVVEDEVCTLQAAARER
jgi:hypothetical protein